MERYKVRITGGPTSMFMHADDVVGAGKLDLARKGAKSKGQKSVAGDDRSPVWSWKTYLYTDGEHVVVPTANLSKCLMEGGSQFTLKGKKTLKQATMSSLAWEEESLPLHLDAKRILTTSDIDAFDDRAEFEEHEARAKKMGFILDVRRASVGTSKHVRVRPKFPSGWWCEGTLLVLHPDLISQGTLQDLLNYCGPMVGIGDWRPSAPKKPGPHGKFTATVKKI